MLSDSHGELLSNGIGWAAWTDGRIKFFAGAGLPAKIRDMPVAPTSPGYSVPASCRTVRTWRW